MLAKKLLMGLTAPTRKVTLVDNASSSSTLTTFDFGSRYIGNASAGRYIVVCVMAKSSASRTISGVTIGGSAATLATKNAAFTHCTGIYYRNVTTGTTANITVTMSGNTDLINIVVYSIEGWSSVTLFDSGSTTASASGITRVSGIDTAANGLAISCITVNLVGVTADFGAQEGQFVTAQINSSCGKEWETSAATGRSIGYSHGSSDVSVSVASFS